MNETLSASAPPIQRGRAIAAKVLSFLFSLAAIGIFSVIIALVAVPKILNAAPLTVLTGSMQPVYNPGDVVVVKKIAPEDLQIGDVVAFHPYPNDPTLITHRIIEKTTDSNGLNFVTRGDANGANDDPIEAKQVAGKVIYSVPKVGHITNRFLTTDNKKQLSLLVGIMLIGYGSYQFTRSLARSKGNEKRAENDEK